MAKLLPFQDATQMLLPHERSDTDHRSLWPWKRWFGKDDTTLPRPEEQAQAPRPNIARRISRKAIPSLPRPGTFKRQQSELRHNLEPVKPKPQERRAFSVDPRRGDQLRQSRTSVPSLPRTSAPVLMGTTVDDDDDDDDVDVPTKGQQTITETTEPEIVAADLCEHSAPITYDVFDDDLEEELEKKWILNLSMHFRDRSNREKFFVTYAETPTHWRRVTISLDYREAPPNSLEEELQHTQYQRDKSARIYEAIRESLPDIQFYDTVTNLKLQTEAERLHVHVTEDIHEVIHFPPVTAINHLYCRRVREQDLVFDSHLSGFVYKVTVNGHVFIKKEIPGPDTVEEFLYEVNALHRLSGSDSVIQFGGVITNNDGTHLKGLLISFAEKGALIDVIYDGKGELSWPRRERWAKQIVQGLSEIHEAGFVQGDFTLSNIVIDSEDKAKIIDINRRGCPVGWEPPEVAALIESKQRISMYIGVKSDIFQLGMVLWAIAMQQDEPETQPRPLTLASASQEIPSYYRALVGICLSDDPRTRCHTTSLLSMFPEMEGDDRVREYGAQPASNHAEAQYIDPANAVERDDIDNFRLMDSQTTEIVEVALSSATHTYVNAPTDMSGEAYFFPTRGRSPPRSPVEEHGRRPSERSQSPTGNGAEWIGVSVAPECEPRVINVSPGRYYLREEEASEPVQNTANGDILLERNGQHEIEDAIVIPNQQVEENKVTKDAAEDNQHILEDTTEAVGNFPQDMLEGKNDTPEGTIQDNNRHVLGDTIEAAPHIPQDMLEDENDSHAVTIEDNSIVPRDGREDIGIVGADADEDRSKAWGSTIEGSSCVNGNATKLGNGPRILDGDAGTLIEDAIGDNAGVSGDGGKDMENVTRDENEDGNKARGSTIEGSSCVPGDATELGDSPHILIGDAPALTEDAIGDNASVSGDGGKDMENVTTELGNSDRNTDEDVTRVVVEDAIEVSTAVPVGKPNVMDPVEVDTACLSRCLSRGDGIRDGVTETEDQGSRLGHVERERENERERERERAVSDLTGIGGHSTLGHSEIPQGISDDDLMTDTR